MRECVGRTGQTLGVRAAAKGLELACRIAPELPDTMLGDPGRLRQIIVNLEGNAIKFTEHGEVLVEVTAESVRQDLVGLHVSVKDTGIGIPADKQAKIFEAFSQADTSTTRKFGGTGLGLTISSQLVRMMKGRIWLESEFGKGTTFHFTATFGVLPGEPVVARAKLSSLKDVPVLIVDDNATNRRIVQEILTSWGLAPSMVEDGPSALHELQLAAARGKPYRLAILDLMMPGMDGFELAEKIGQRDELADVTLLMISSAARPGDADRCHELGIARYMTKPILQSDLLNVILELHGEPIVDEILASAPPSRDGKVKLKILLAEDGLVNQRVAVGLLERHGDEVFIANNGREAVAAFEKESFDLILMDLQMPEMDGVEATHAIRRRDTPSQRRTPIIAMTAAAMKGDRERCLEAGMDGYISKPVNPEELFRVLDEYALQKARQQPSSSRAAAAQTETSTANESDTIDLGIAAQRIVGGDEGIREVATLLLAECPKMMAEIDESLAAADAPRLQRAAHTLKGAASVFGGQQTVDAAELVEQLAHDDNLDAAPAALNDLIAAVQELESALRAYVGEQKSAPTTSAEGK